MRRFGKDRSERHRAASATGCQGVTGLVPARWAARTPGFWRELGGAMGLAHPTWETFRGSGGALG
ncbi:MAG: hypothetical protein ACLP36_10150 [Acidimicrobiales bacterium]